MRRGQWALALTVFIDLLGFTLVLPGLPFFTRHLGASGAGVGVAMAAYSLAQFVASPLLGRLSDRFGRRPLLLASLAGSTVSLALLALAPSLLWLVGARALAGAFGGSIGVGQAFMADLAAPEQRTRAMGFIGAAIGAAFVLGPGLGAALSPLGFPASCAVAAGLAGANFLLATAWLPRDQGAGGRQRRAVGRLLRSTAVAPLVSATLLSMAAFAGMEATFALLGQRRFGLGPAWVGAVLSAAGVVMIIVQLGLVAPLADRYGERTVAVSGVLLMGAGLLALPIAPLPGCVAAVCLLAAGEGLFTPTSATLLTRAVPADVRGQVLGAAQSASALARALGPAAAGALFDRAISIPYVFGAAAMLIAAAALAVPQPGLSADRELAELLTADGRQR
ncbi:MAG: MFS transporter [Mycobacteriales bacterium]